jgi:hypothetical protein
MIYLFLINILRNEPFLPSVPAFGFSLGTCVRFFPRYLRSVFREHFCSISYCLQFIARNLQAFFLKKKGECTHKKARLSLGFRLAFSRVSLGFFAGIPWLFRGYPLAFSRVWRETRALPLAFSRVSLGFRLA